MTHKCNSLPLQASLFFPMYESARLLSDPPSLPVSFPISQRKLWNTYRTSLCSCCTRLKKKSWVRHTLFQFTKSRYGHVQMNVSNQSESEKKHTFYVCTHLSALPHWHAGVHWLTYTLNNSQQTHLHTFESIYSLGVWLWIHSCQNIY